VRGGDRDKIGEILLYFVKFFKKLRKIQKSASSFAVSLHL
jgi:hypothetical protein